MYISGLRRVLDLSRRRERTLIGVDIWVGSDLLIAHSLVADCLSCVIRSGLAPCACSVSLQTVLRFGMLVLLIASPVVQARQVRWHFMAHVSLCVRRLDEPVFRYYEVSFDLLFESTTFARSQTISDALSCARSSGCACVIL